MTILKLKFGLRCHVFVHMVGFSEGNIRGLPSPVGEREVPGSLFHLIETEQINEETDFCEHVCGGNAGDTHVGDCGGSQRGDEFARLVYRNIFCGIAASRWCRSRNRGQPFRSDSVWTGRKVCRSGNERLLLIGSQHLAI